MTKRLNAKYKIDRRLGCNLWGRPKSPYNRRNSRPGQHGQQRQRRKLSDYGTQFFAKQKMFRHVPASGTARRDPPRHGDFDAQILVKKGLM